MKRLVAVLLPIVVGAALLVPRGAAQGTNAKPLEIWVVDVEGGKAALYVSPTGQTALIDTGFPGARDHDRIMAAIADAGVKQIDYLVSTHYHVDHIGGLDGAGQPNPDHDLRRSRTVGGGADGAAARAGRRAVSPSRNHASRSRASRRRTPSSTARRSASS